jgi:hypothetical protein
MSVEAKLPGGLNKSNGLFFFKKKSNFIPQDLIYLYNRHAYTEA